ncbi:Hsp70 chaperone protein, partial [Fusarium pseudoanthophilum]
EGDVFTILDAGGGTCDALTYTVTRDVPLRLERQLAHHSGGNCGSNALNNGFRKLLESLHANHDYLNQGGVTLEGHIRKLAVHDFEYLVKPGENVNGIYRHVCEEVSMLVAKQLQATAQRGLIPDHVVLMGGFGESKPLRAHLRKALASFNDAHDSDTALYVPDERERVAGCSYGIRYDEPFELPKHAGLPRIEGFEMKQELRDVAHLLRRPLLFAKGGAQDPSDNGRMDLYWKVPYELVLTIDGLNMNCVQLFNGQQIGELKVGIAPGFTPGAN